MTYALLDNATLTAVQRLLGQAPTKSKDSVDSDIVALEGFVQAILFYDRIVVIDDYIPEFQAQRHQFFSFLEFLPPAELNLARFEDLATKTTQELRPVIRAGEFENPEFKSLLEQLQAHMVCTWDISSSVYHLSLKVLAESNSEEFHKYGALATAIFSELGDAKSFRQHVSGDVELIDRYGNPIRPGYQVPGAKWGSGQSSGEPSKAIRAFVASLTWLANRTIYYTLLAKHLNADTFLYPIRQVYQQQYVAQRCGYGTDYAKRIVTEFSKVMGQDIIDIHRGGVTAASALDLPIFSAWLAQRTGKVTEIIGAAVDLRNHPEFVSARALLREVRQAFDDDQLRDANQLTRKIANSIEKCSRELRAKYGIQTRQGVPVTRLIQTYNAVAAAKALPAVPEFDFKIKIPEFISSVGTKTGFGAIYRNVAADLSTIWSLGNTRDILGSGVRVEKNAIAYAPKNEAPRFRYSHSPFKSPM